MRDINQYTEEYLKEGFESLMVEFRRKKVLSFLGDIKPRRIIEIGCGAHPLFEFYNDFEEFFVYEPSEQFYNIAMSIRGGILEFISSIRLSA